MQLSHRLNSHGLVKPNEKKCIRTVFKSMLLSCLISVPANIVSVRNGTAHEKHIPMIHSSVFHPAVLFTVICKRTCLPSLGITAGNILVLEIQDVNAVPHGSPY